MVKLNYVNRKITGIKLGQSIQRDILKRIPKLGDEKKLAAIQRDPVIEIDVSGRQLGEEGLALLCDAIEELAETKLSKVEELGLSGNDLTVECLRHLRRAIYMCPDLRDIDISNNNITIRTSSDIEEWTSFLRSFRMLRGLRRLEASNNPIGDIGLEILLRVYASEKDIFIPYDSSGASMEEPENEGSDVNYVVEGFDIRQSGGHLYLASHFPQTVEVDTFEIGQRKASNGTTSSSGHIFMSNTPNSSDLADLHGLRGTPYIILSNVGATDLGAMWMSHIITNHPLPSELQRYMSPLKEGTFATTLRKYDFLSNYRGIVLMDNPSITPLGDRVLQEAESRRDEDAADVDELMNNGKSRRRSSAAGESSSEEGTRVCRYSIQDEFSNYGSLPKLRRIALEQAQERWNVERTRGKIQSNVIKEKGVHASLLWGTAMRMIVVSRALLLNYTGPILINGKEPTVQVDAKTSGVSTNGTSVEHMPVSAHNMSSRGPTMKRLSGLSLRSAGKRTEGFLDGSMPGQLPIAIWMKIISLAEDSHNLTTEIQRVNIFHWARSRSSIRTELEYLSESMDSQARRVLGRVRALTYEL